MLRITLISRVYHKNHSMIYVRLFRTISETEKIPTGLPLVCYQPSLEQVPQETCLKLYLISTAEHMYVASLNVQENHWFNALY